MPNSKEQWTPGPMCLNVDLDPGQTQLTWAEYRRKLKQRVRQLAERTRDPIETLESLWLDLDGHCPSMRTPEQVVESAEFQNVIRDRHQVRSSMFPMKVEPMDLTEEDFPDLDSWMKELMPPLAD